MVPQVNGRNVLRLKGANVNLSAKNPTNHKAIYTGYLTQPTFYPLSKHGRLPIGIVMGLLVAKTVNATEVLDGKGSIPKLDYTFSD